MMKLRYTGTKQPGLNPKQKTADRPLYPYLPSPELVEVTQWAIDLERPLLLMGRPGSGKTQLAHAVAFELGLPLEEWYVRSTSRVVDGLYLYDAVGRIRDAQLVAAGLISPSEVMDSESNLRRYVRMGPIGRAFERKQRTIVLIDEIDKADIDFPNDLLQVLDEGRFTIEELGVTVKASKPPIVFITSNDEKDLPDAFLRRCLFFYIEFPNAKELEHILAQRFGAAPADLITRAVERFEGLRQNLEESRPETAKRMSTSELIDWFKLLVLNPDAQSRLNDDTVPFANALLKSPDDLKLATRKLRGK